MSVLKDMYENNMSVYFAAKKYGIRSRATIMEWEKRYPIDSDSLSLSAEVITKVKTMRAKNEPIGSPAAGRSREEELVQEIADLRKALAYSELRNEALHEVLNIGKEQYGIDLLKKLAPSSRQPSAQASRCQHRVPERTVWQDPRRLLFR